MESPVLLMDKIEVVTGKVVIGMTVDNQIIRIDSKGETLNRGVYPESVALAICHNTK